MLTPGGDGIVVGTGSDGREVSLGWPREYVPLPIRLNLPRLTPRAAPAGFHLRLLARRTEFSPVIALDYMLVTVLFQNL